MALSQSQLANDLSSLIPTESESDAIELIGNIWEDYFYESTVSGVKPGSDSLDGAIDALKLALSGMSADGQAATKIQSAITAFWAAVQSGAASIYVVPGFVVTAGSAPTTVSAISAALAATFVANVAGSLSLEDSASAIAAILHTNGGLGGTVTLTPTAPPNTPVLTPIL